MSDCRLTLKTVLTDQTFTTCVMKEKLEKPSTKRSEIVLSSLGSVEM